MTAGVLLTRAGRGGSPAPPVRLVHLGLGNFFRAHQAWYTAHAPDASEWGIAAFTGRGPASADTLARQDGLYTLITRAATGDEFETISTVSEVHPAADHDAWLRLLARPQVAVVTMTVTEAGYTRNGSGGLDLADRLVAADIDALRADPRARVSTAVGRLVAGLAARWAAGTGELAVVPCDNLPGNGPVLAGLVTEFADLIRPDLSRWIETNVCFVTTAVDRITPATTPEELTAVEQALGYRDAAPVVTEPFREWVLCGEFPAGRPRWDEVGAVRTGDITTYERRKLWLLNGAHSLLAYTAPLRGHDTVADAVADPVCLAWLRQWWDEATPHLGSDVRETNRYRRALLERFANPRMRHRLVQIAMDGSRKLPVRILPVLRQERAAGRLPAGAIRVLAGWICHLSGQGVAVSDPAAAGIREVDAALALLDPTLVADRALRAAVVAELARLRLG
ncbi:mannitol dehydrogenase family protein [Nocardia farcinica]|uniref:mannitol dehydrogenase family protein n=1 Tax=Nocardia farcinica TaxID=37329 RepID=UPI0037A4A854